MAGDKEKLLRAASKGDIEAFEVLTGNYHKKIFNIMLAYCGKSDQASELTQEVFVRVFKDLNLIKGTNLLGFSIYKTAGEITRDYSFSSGGFQKKYIQGH